MNNGENNVNQNQTMPQNSLFINNELLQNSNQVTDFGVGLNQNISEENPDLEKTVVMNPINDTILNNQQPTLFVPTDTPVVEQSQMEVPQVDLVQPIEQTQSFIQNANSNIELPVFNSNVQNGEVSVENPDLEKTIVMNPINDTILNSQQPSLLEPSMNQGLEQPVVDNIQPMEQVQPFVPDMNQGMEQPVVDNIQPMEQQPLFVPDMNQVVEQPVVDNVQPMEQVQPFVPDMNQVVEQPVVDNVQPMEQVQPFVPDMNQGMEQPVVDNVQPMEQVQPFVPDMNQGMELPPVNNVQSIDQPPLLVPDINRGVGIAPMNNDISSVMIDQSQIPSNVAVLENSQIPQLDPTIPVVAPIVGGGLVATQSEETVSNTTPPDLLFSSNNPQTSTEVEPTPIPMDSNGQSNYESTNYQYGNESVPPSSQPVSQADAANEQLIRAFVGDRYYSRGRHSFFNIWGFLFGGLYVVYRKMYLLGILIIVAQNLVINYLHINQLLVSIIVGAVVGLFFNIFYMMHVNNSINAIKKRYTSNIPYICQRKGGTSFGATILVMILFIVVVAVLTLYLGIKTFATDLLKDLNFDFSSFGISGTVTDEYNENIEYYVSKLKFFMKNTDPDQGYTPEISNKELLKVTMPRAKQESDYVGCSLDNRQQGWYDAVGYVFKPGSTDCKIYMQNAEEYIGDTMPLPDSALIIFNGKKELGPGTKIDYKDSTCMYNAEKQKFECRKK